MIRTTQEIKQEYKRVKHYKILGTKDYIMDCWHDMWFWVWSELSERIEKRMRATYCWQKNEGCYTKEGNIKHYIANRKVPYDKCKRCLSCVVKQKG